MRREMLGCICSRTSKPPSENHSISGLFKKIKIKIKKYKNNFSIGLVFLYIAILKSAIKNIDF
jgi:hypothetical protein